MVKMFSHTLLIGDKFIAECKKPIFHGERTILKNRAFCRIEKETKKNEINLIQREYSLINCKFLFLYGNELNGKELLCVNSFVDRRTQKHCFDKHTSSDRVPPFIIERSLKPTICVKSHDIEALSKYDKIEAINEKIVYMPT